MNRFTLLGFIFLGLIFVSSCTDLDETINTQVTPDQFFKNEVQFVSALGDAYTVMATGGDNASGLGASGGYQALQENTSDEWIIPARGPDWSEGGNWVRVYNHKWRPESIHVNDAWIMLFSGVNNSNRLILQFESLLEEGDVEPELANSFIAELKVLRSYYYLQLLDQFGNVPILRRFDVEQTPGNNPNFQEGRTELFNFIDSTVTANIGNLSTNIQETRVRVNKFVGHMVLAKLYMNAEAYVNEPMWEEAFEQLNKVEEGGYSLTGNFATNFVEDNGNSPEIIFQIPYDRVNLTGFNIPMMTLHYQQQNTFELQSQPWNGHSATSQLYNSLIDPDLNPGPQGEVIGLDGKPTTGTIDDRNRFSVGVQMNASGTEPIEDASFGITNDESDIERGTWDSSAVVRLTPLVDELQPNTNRQAGARILKYDIPRGSTPNLSNDFVIYRYADVILLKAEAMMRMSGNENNPQALELVNKIRTRASVEPFEVLTFDKLLTERGRELFYELVRRTDLIRFEGKEGETRFNDSWRFKGVSESFRNVFPIPTDQMETNERLVQNPGY